MNRVKHAVNTGGRDFICGDLHGAFIRLQQFMEHVNFDIKKDRLFSVGDLVDRGPDNYKCLSLIHEKWFYPVKGNHEMLMHDYYSNGPTGGWWLHNGGAWGAGFKHDTSDLAADIRDLADQASKLPVMRTIEMENGKSFHVIHAELNSIKPLTDADLDDENIFSCVAFDENMDGESILWGRFIFYTLYAAPLDNNTIDKFKRTAEYHKMGAMFTDSLSHIYSGHTIMQKPARFKGQTNIDTGAFHSVKDRPPTWAGLTVTEPLTDKFWHCSEEGVQEVSPVVLG